ncbi:hypothetical protein M8120_00050 [Microcystis aeruginosa str. Chao 1910]|nr:hypothetical protein M8120_00050 [Microcystis aeruginosa str. Chao 1910]
MKVQRYVFKLQKRILQGAKTSCIPNNGTVKLGAVGGESLMHGSEWEGRSATTFSTANN